MKIAVVGARGQLGAAIVEACAASHEVIALARADLDLADDAAVAAVMTRIRPEALINAAASSASNQPRDAFTLRFASRSHSSHPTTRRGLLVPK